MIENESRGRAYEQSPCETGSWFIGRLRTEASRASEPWIFVMIPQVRDVGHRMYQSWASGRVLRPFDMTWYFEARGRVNANR